MRLSAATLASSDCSETAIAATRRRKLQRTTPWLRAPSRHSLHLGSSTAASSSSALRNVVLQPVACFAACCSLCAGTRPGSRGDMPRLEGRPEEGAMQPRKHHARIAPRMIRSRTRHVPPRCFRRCGMPGVAAPRRLQVPRLQKEIRDSPRAVVSEKTPNHPEYNPSMLRVCSEYTVRSEYGVRVSSEYTPSML